MGRGAEIKVAISDGWKSNNTIGWRLQKGGQGRLNEGVLVDG